MKTPTDLETAAKVESDSQTETAQVKRPQAHISDKQKLLIAGLVLAASAAVALSQTVPLFKDGLSGSMDLRTQQEISTPQTLDQVAGKEAGPRDEMAGGAVDQPAASRSNMAAAPVAPAAVAADKTSNEALAKDGEMKEKAAVLPPLGQAEGRMDQSPARMTQPGLPDLGHGYNAPAYLIKQASLQLEVGNIQDSFARISALTEKYHGYLVDSSLNNYENSQPGAELHIKLPSDKLSAALAELDGLGTVRNTQIKTEDIWLQIKRQQLDIDHLKGKAQATQPGDSQREQQFQIKQQQLEQLRLEQMLKMATLDLRLAERAPFWDLRPLGEELRSKSFASLQATTRLLAEVLLFLPPLLIFLGLAWLGWGLLKNVLITRLALLSERALGGIYVAGMVFFPLCAMGPQGLGPVLLFGLLVGSAWAARTLYHWLKQRQASAHPPASVPVEAAPPLV